jgi:cystinosin
MLDKSALVCCTAAVCPALLCHASVGVNNSCYFCSFIKMGVTLVKYIPQVAMNHSRQSTQGWSVDNVLLDLAGGLLSVTQVLISCQVLNNWVAVTGRLQLCA